MNYLDIDSDEADDIRELYQEARAMIDTQYPRGDIQWNWIRTQNWDRWSSAHDFWYDMERAQSWDFEHSERIAYPPERI